MDVVLSGAAKSKKVWSRVKARRLHQKIKDAVAAPGQKMGFEVLLLRGRDLEQSNYPNTTQRDFWVVFNGFTDDVEVDEVRIHQGMLEPFLEVILADKKKRPNFSYSTDDISKLSKTVRGPNGEAVLSYRGVTMGKHKLKQSDATNAAKSKDDSKNIFERFQAIWAGICVIFAILLVGWKANGIMTDEIQKQMIPVNKHLGEIDKTMGEGFKKLDYSINGNPETGAKGLKQDVEYLRGKADAK